MNWTLDQILRMGDSLRLTAVLHELIPQDMVFSAAEVGVYRGDTSAALLEAFPEMRLLMVDSWTTHPYGGSYWKSGDSCAKQTMAQQEFNVIAARQNTQFAWNRREVLRMPSLEAAHDLMARGAQFYVVFVDGDHTLNAVREDIAAWWPLVLPGGIMCGHDIDHPRDCKGVWGVRRAVEEHCRRHRLQLFTLGTLWWVRKPTC